MAVEIKVEQDFVTAYLSGELDHHTVREMREQIDDTAAQNGPATLILDFRSVTFMDSSGIGLVMGRYKLMEELGGKVVLANLPGPIKKVMRVAGMDKLADFH